MKKITKDGCELSGRSDQIRNRAVMSHLYGIVKDPFRLGQGMCELSVDPTKPFILKINVGMLVFDGIMVENDEPFEIDLSNQMHTNYFVYAMYNFESDVNTFTVQGKQIVIEPDLIDNPDDIGWVLVGTIGIDSPGIQIVDSTGDTYDPNMLNVIEPPTELLRQTFDELQELKKSMEWVEVRPSAQTNTLAIGESFDMGITSEEAIGKTFAASMTNVPNNGVAPIQDVVSGISVPGIGEGTIRLTGAYNSGNGFALQYLELKNTAGTTWTIISCRTTYTFSTSPAVLSRLGGFYYKG